ncbi:hypothetical protein XELAEV_18041629mg [Xenopus laevis]|uniref:Uncharacterized protein n=1 Tax=Xenopus laevis TaxID=8355 RepID=A0A974H596_XENLA|nr:hypothetical protein XELAEV_18041629mg [Xenopus laevis]
MDCLPCVANFPFSSLSGSAVPLSLKTNPFTARGETNQKTLVGGCGIKKATLSFIKARSTNAFYNSISPHLGQYFYSRDPS